MAFKARGGQPHVVQAQDILVAHFEGDQASLEAFLDLQMRDLGALEDFELAHEVAEALLFDSADSTDVQHAQRFVDEEELRWAQVCHDAAFARELACVRDEEWEDIGDLIKQDFKPDAAPVPSSDVYSTWWVPATCGICFEAGSQLLPVARCSHSFCGMCLSTYITSKVLEHEVPIMCCSPDCSEPVSLKLIQHLAGQDVAEAHERHLAEAAIENRVFCPYAGCSAVFELDEEVADVMCLECRRLFCASCRVRWHDGLSCEEYRQLPEDLRSPEDVALLHVARNKAWRSCPECRSLISKVEGDCNWMRCRCGCAFCFKCGNEYTDNVPQAGNVHGRAGCTCPLFDVLAGEEEQEMIGEMIGEGLEEEVKDEEDVELVINEPPEQPVGLVHLGNARMRSRQFVDLVRYQATVDSGSKTPSAWLAAVMARNQCFYCARKFQSLEALSRHLSTTRQHAVYACCGRIFTDRNGFANHAECHRRRK